jgi:PAS domain-containing protein
LAAHLVERGRADAALRQSEGRLRAFVTASSDAVYQVKG